MKGKRNKCKKPVCFILGKTQRFQVLQPLLLGQSQALLDLDLALGDIACIVVEDTITWALTADGKFHLCLLNDDELDVKKALKQLPENATNEQAKAVFAPVVEPLLSVNKCRDFVVNRDRKSVV